MVKSNLHHEHKKKIHKKGIYEFLGGKKEFTKENIIEGMIMRPLILMTAFLSFVIGVLAIYPFRNYKWAGSFIVFSFVFNIYSIYQSFKDKESIFRTLNLTFKIVLFLLEIIFFNYIAIKAGLYSSLTLY